MKILVIDDDEDIRNSVSLAIDLYWSRSQAFAAASGEEGIRMLENHKPDMVILDLGLPDVDGLQLCQQIREDYEIPVIILSVRDRREDVVKGLSMGAADYMTKPFSPKELMDRVRAVAREQSLQSESDETMTRVFAEA